jgi:hypothetical protein
MEKANKVLVRLSVTDIILTQEQAESLPSFLTVVNENGGYITETAIYAVGYEDEDGNECEEEGYYLN